MPPLPPIRRPSLDALTGLRFLAAMAVVGFHFYCPPCEPGLPSFGGKLLQAGFTAVSLFFVLSGFILAYNYLGERGGFVGTAWDFCRARFARLYPIYLLSLVVDLPLFIRAILLAEPAATTSEVARIAVATLTMTQAWLPTGRPSWNIVAWTLSVEAFFYAVFPLIGPWLSRQGSRRLLALAGGIWLLGVTPMLAGHAAAGLGTEDAPALVVRGLLAWSQLPAVALPLSQFPAFFLGMCLGLLFCRRTATGSTALRTAGLLATAASLLGLLLVLPGKPSLLVQMAVLVPLFALLIWLLAGGTAWNGLLLGTRPLVLLGGASYALYMVHSSVGNYALALNTRTLTLPHNAVALLSVPLAMSTSLLLFRFVEEPVRHWLRRPVRAPAATSSPLAPSAGSRS
jgi:peptidoglycan/LPS O-acetylase OafA/YrhL